MFRMKRLHVSNILLLFVLIRPLGMYAQEHGENFTTLSEDGAWSWFSDPRAVYDKNEGREQIYFGFINSKGDVVIGQKDLNRDELHTFVLHEKLQIDDHNVPSILILPDKRLLVFYTEHNGRFFMRRSKRAGDIREWEEEQVIAFGGNKITYSHPVMLEGEDNRIYMFWRGSDWQQALAYSDDFGESWSDAQVLISSRNEKGKARNRPYLKVSSDGISRIDVIFTDGHPGVEPLNSVYHFYYEKGAFYQTDGRFLSEINGLPILRESVQKVYHAEEKTGRSWISDVALDQEGHPVICYVRFPKDTDHRYHYAHWDGDKWVDEEICKAGGWMPDVPEGEKIREPHYSGGIVIDHSHPNNIYLSRSVRNRFEIEHWKKGESGWLSQSLTERSFKDNIRPYVVKTPSDKPPVVLWMNGRYEHYTKFDTKILMY